MVAASGDWAPAFVAVKGARQVRGGRFGLQHAARGTFHISQQLGWPAKETGADSTPRGSRLQLSVDLVTVNIVRIDVVDSDHLLNCQGGHRQHSAAMRRSAAGSS